MDICDIKRLAPDALTLKGDTMNQFITFIDSKELTLQPDPAKNDGKGKIKTWTKGGGIVLDVKLEDLNDELQDTGTLYSATLNFNKGISISIFNKTTGERMVCFPSQDDPASPRYANGSANGKSKRRTAKAASVDAANPLGE